MHTNEFIMGENNEKRPYRAKRGRRSKRVKVTCGSIRVPNAPQVDFDKLPGLAALKNGFIPAWEVAPKYNPACAARHSGLLGQGGLD